MGEAKQVLPPGNSQVQSQLFQLQEYAAANDMKINQHKSKVMLFNTGKSNDFTPELTMDGTSLEVVEKMKLLGVIITA